MHKNFFCTMIWTFGDKNAGDGAVFCGISRFEGKIRSRKMRENPAKIPHLVTSRLVSGGIGLRQNWSPHNWSPAELVSKTKFKKKS